MVDPARSFMQHVGHVVFPRGPQDLTDTSRCPACFNELPATAVCRSCGLDLNHPDAARLHQASLSAASALDARLELIAKIRVETNAAIANAAQHAQPTQQAQPVLATAAATPPAHTATESASSIFPQPTAASPPSEAAKQPELRPRSHSGVQVLLLVVGVSLLSIGAIFFLIYAFLTFGLLWRSAIIASITIASIVAATRMKQRGLAATAEALSVLAIVFVILDIYALRANDLLVVGDAEGRLYWGGALLIVTIGFMLWHRATALVLVSVVGYIGFPFAAALLTAGLARDEAVSTRWLMVVAALAAASLIHWVAAHGNYRAIVERVVTTVYAMGAFAAALVIGAVASFESSGGSTAVWFAVLAALAALHAVLTRGHDFAEGIRYAFAVAFGLLFGSALWIAIVPSSLPADGLQARPSTILVVLATLTFTALILEVLGRRLSTTWRSVLVWGSAGVWTIAAIAALAPLGRSLAVAFQFVDGYSARRSTSGLSSFDLRDSVWPQLALLVVPLAMLLVWWLSGQLRARIHLVLGVAGVTLTVLAPLTGTLFSTVVSWLVLAALAVAVIALHRSRRGPRRVHITIAAVALLPLLLAYSSGWSSHETWAFTSVATAAVLVAARSLSDGVALRATLSAIAAVVLLRAAAAVGEALQYVLTPGLPNPLESWMTFGLAAVVVLAFALWPRWRTGSGVDRRTLWWVGLVSTALAAANLWTSSVQRVPWTTAPLTLDLPLISLVIAIVALALLAVSLTQASLREHRGIRYASAALLAPGTVWALDSASRAWGLSDIAIHLAPATASVLIGTLSVVMRLRASDPQVRRISEASALVIAGIATTNAAITQRESHWIIILLVAITLLLASISRDGLFGSVSLRRHAVWAAVAFGTWALWLRLDQRSVSELEAYVLPLAAAVLVIAVFTARAELRISHLVAAPAITLAGLLIAVLPLGLNAASGEGLRTLVVAGLCGAVLLAASFIEPVDRLVSLWGVTIIGSGVGLIAATATRALVLASESRSWLPELDSWLLGAVAVIALASFGLAASSFTREPANARWAATSETLLGAAIVLLFVVETVVLLLAGSSGRALDSIRIVALVTLGAVLLLLSARQSRPPLTHRLSYLGFAAASVVAVIAMLGGLITPLEWVSAPLGFALLIHGGIQMLRDPAVRSFSALSAGLAVTLIPSLLATFLDTDSAATPWRILAVGVAAVLAIVAGSWLKLQAPLIFGSAVALIHAAHTFAPALVTLYQLTDWWVWAVVGGAIVLFLGITLERRIRDLKVLNSRFSSLR